MTTIEINLLPWRAQVSERRRKRFYLFLALSAVLGLAAGGGASYHYQQQLSAQQQRNAHVRQQMTELDVAIRSIGEYEALREQMLERIEIFTRLQQGRALTVELYDQLAASLEEGVHYTRLARQGDTLRLVGLAEDNRQVSNQLRALAQAPVFDVPVLSEVENEADQGLRRFSLSVTQRTPGKPDSAASEESP